MTLQELRQNTSYCHFAIKTIYNFKFWEELNADRLQERVHCINPFTHAELIQSYRDYLESVGLKDLELITEINEEEDFYLVNGELDSFF